MEPVMIILLFIAIILIIVIAVLQAEKKRTESVKEKAFQRGYQFTAKTGIEMIVGHENLNLFNQGHSRRVVNLIQKPGQSANESIFDYMYVTGHGKHRSEHRQTVYYFQSERMNLPVFALRPEHIFHKIGQLFGYQDIDFTNHPEFSKHYILRGKDQDKITRLFTHEIITGFENEKGISVEGAGSHLIVYRGGKRNKPELIFDAYESALKIFLAFQRRSEYSR